MSPIAIGILIAFLSALCWAGLDTTRKALGERLSAVAAVAGMSLFQLPVLAVVMGVGEVVAPQAKPWSLIFAGFEAPAIAYIAPFLGSVSLNLLANWLFFRAVQRSPLGLTIPYLSFTPVFTLVTGFLVLDQSPTALAFVGVVIVTLGAFFLNPGNGDTSLLEPFRALWRERGSLYMLVVAAIWSVTPILDKLAADRTNVPTHTGLLAAGLFLAFWLGRAVHDRSATKMLREMRAAPMMVVAMGSLTVVAMLLQLSSYSFVDVAYVETIKRAVGVVAAVLVGWLVFDEGHLRRRLVAVSVMAIGVALVMFAP